MAWSISSRLRLRLMVGRWRNNSSGSYLEGTSTSRPWRSMLACSLDPDAHPADPALSGELALNPVQLLTTISIDDAVAP